MQDASSVTHRFSRAAATYDSSVGVQAMVAGAVADMFKKIGPFDRVLEVGCGSGLLTEKACHGPTLSGAEFIALDISKEMLTRTQRKLHAQCPAQWIHRDFLAYEPKALFDCIISSSALHWILPLEQAIGQCRRLLSQRGQLVFGMMIAGTLAELHGARRHIAPSQPVKDPLPQDEEIEEMLTSNGFSIKAHRIATYREEFSSAETFLKTLHNRGVTGGGISHGDRLLSRKEMKDLTRWYNLHYRTESGGVFATYQVLFIHAVREEPLCGASS